MNKDERLYGLRDDEAVQGTVRDVIERLVGDAVEKVGEPLAATLDRIEWPVVVQVFRRMDVSRDAQSIADNALECALELLDEEHSDPDGDATEPTAEMRKAAEAFAAVVVAEYVSWACEPTGERIEVTREQAKEMLS